MFRFEKDERNELLRRMRIICAQHALDSRFQMTPEKSAEFVVLVVESAIEMRTNPETSLMLSAEDVKHLTEN